MVNFQKLESSVAGLEKQLQEVKEQIAEIRNAYQEECHPGKTDIRQYILEKATERFGENYMKPEEDRGFFDDFYDAVKRKVKKDSMIMGYSENGVGTVFAIMQYMYSKHVILLKWILWFNMMKSKMLIMEVQEIKILLKSQYHRQQREIIAHQY